MLLFIDNALTERIKTIFLHYWLTVAVNLMHPDINFWVSASLEAHTLFWDTCTEILGRNSENSAAVLWGLALFKRWYPNWNWMHLEGSFSLDFIVYFCVNIFFLLSNVKVCWEKPSCTWPEDNCHPWKKGRSMIMNLQILLRSMGCTILSEPTARHVRCYGC